MPAVLEAKVEQLNYPTYVTRYQDPATKFHKTVVVTVLPGDVEDYDIFIPEMDGKKGYSNKVTITYPWPQVLTSGEELFSEPIKNGIIEKFHPKILVIDYFAAKLKVNKNDVICNTLTIHLPCAVQITGYIDDMFKFKNPDTNVTTVVVVIDLHEVDTAYVSTVRKRSIGKVD